MINTNELRKRLNASVKSQTEYLEVLDLLNEIDQLRAALTNAKEAFDEISQGLGEVRKNLDGLQWCL